MPSPRPFLNYEQWVKLRKLGKARISEPDLNPRTRRQRQELYWFLLMCVGAALRVGEAYSLRWRDCELIRLGDKDHAEAVHMRVLGKHARGGKREERDRAGLSPAFNQQAGREEEQKRGDDVSLKTRFKASGPEEAPAGAAAERGEERLPRSRSPGPGRRN